jgi:hypothetical protein
VRGPAAFSPQLNAAQDAEPSGRNMPEASRLLEEGDLSRRRPDQR